VSTFRLTRPLLFALPIAAVVAFAAGCGGSSSASPPVASVAGSTPGKSPAPPTPPTEPGGGSGHFGLTLKVAPGADGRKFSSCMRSHGIPSFPDPNGQGEIAVSGGPGSDLDPSSPKFQSAQQACRKLLPNGGRASPAQVAAAQKKALEFSACMRKHGLPDYPDPTFSGGHTSVLVRGGRGSDLNPNSPRFQAAMKACGLDLPGKIGTGLTHAGTK
jgi:hypothetical protein